MKENSVSVEREEAIEAGRKMMIAARTAPKARGRDYIETILVYGEELNELAQEMEKIGKEYKVDFFLRDADNVRQSDCVVLIGTVYNVRELNKVCGFCNYDNCGECFKNNGVCAYNNIDLGIAIGSAVSVAADLRVDNRVMFSAAKAAMKLHYFESDVKSACAIPVSVKGKSLFYDRDRTKYAQIIEELKKNEK